CQTLPASAQSIVGPYAPNSGSLTTGPTPVNISTAAGSLNAGTVIINSGPSNISPGSGAAISLAAYCCGSPVVNVDLTSTFRQTRLPNIFGYGYGYCCGNLVIGGGSVAVSGILSNNGQQLQPIPPPPIFASIVINNRERLAGSDEAMTPAERIAFLQV